VKRRFGALFRVPNGKLARTTEKLYDFLVNDRKWWEVVKTVNIQKERKTIATNRKSALLKLSKKSWTWPFFTKIMEFWTICARSPESKKEVLKCQKCRIVKAKLNTNQKSCLLGYFQPQYQCDRWWKMWISPICSTHFWTIFKVIWGVKRSRDPKISRLAMHFVRSLGRVIPFWSF